MRNSDKPQGEERAIVKAFEKMTREIHTMCERLGDRVSDTDLRFIVDFARDGVRTNGCEKLTTIFDAVQPLTALRDEIKKGLADFQRAVVLIHLYLQQSERLLKNYQQCPACKGKHGRKVKREYHPYLRRWVDCETCAGRGMIQATVKSKATAQ